MVDLGQTSIVKNIQGMGFPVQSLRMRPGKPNPICLLRLVRWLREDPPDLVSTWQYHGDLIGGIAAWLAGGIPLVWNIRHSNLKAEDYKHLTILTAKVCARLSRWLPNRIICCSESSRTVHEALGYEAEKMVVIPNGYDLESFRPDSVARQLVQKELGIPEEAPVIGAVAGFRPQKDHHTFIQATGLIHQDRPDVHFVLCGHGVDYENKVLRTLIEEAGVLKQCHLLGVRDDMPKLTAAFDVASLSSSSGEGFPNVVAEAMSCGVPCVVTDVGDAARIVGQTGLVVPPKNPAALAAALGKMLDLGREGRRQLGMSARQQIKERFAIAQIVARYETLFEDIVSNSNTK